MARILIFGDSIVFGNWDAIGGGWADRLKQYCMKKELENPELDYSVYNLGISGDSTGNLLERFEFEAKQRIYNKEETTVIFAIGLNDSQIGSIGISPEKFRKNIGKLIEAAGGYSSKIIFVGLIPVDELKTNPISWDENMFYKNERIEKYDEIIKSICRENNIYFIDMLGEFSKLDYKKLLEDGLHPNSAGHKKMFEIVRDFLKLLNYGNYKRFHSFGNNSP